ncbi:MAG TPA: GNAT family N-acetyltransferase [Streptosporangiaceae bacterium]|nr:GNAT family N-acetyltransferase [Streptosporangiaceae bacterium]
MATFEQAPRSAAAWSRLAADLAGLGLPFLVAEAEADGAIPGGAIPGGAIPGGAIAGYAYAGPWRNKPAYRATVEDSIFIAPAQTGRGIGKLLLTDLITACAGAGARQMVAVMADSGATASIALHESCGFTRAGRLVDVGYKHGQWISTVFMQRAVG